MSDGQSAARHYQRLGKPAAKMVAAVRAPVLNVIDAIWVSHRALAGFPRKHRARQSDPGQPGPRCPGLLAAKNVCIPDRQQSRHHRPIFAGIRRLATQARRRSMTAGGLYKPDGGPRGAMSHRSESGMQAFTRPFPERSPAYFFTRWPGRIFPAWERRFLGERGYPA